MPSGLATKRIEDIFDEAIALVRKGKKPNVSGLMTKYGYSISSCHTLKITQSKKWQSLLDEIDEDRLLNNVRTIANDVKDKKYCLSASDMLLKLKGRYPDKKVSITKKITKDITEITEPENKSEVIPKEV